jgi:hypothetical protein
VVEFVVGVVMEFVVGVVMRCVMMGVRRTRNGKNIKMKK